MWARPVLVDEELLEHGFNAVAVGDGTRGSGGACRGSIAELAPRAGVGWAVKLSSGPTASTRAGRRAQGGLLFPL